MTPARDQGEHDLMQVSEIKEQPEGETINQYTPIDEDEHKEIDRKSNLNSARVFLYQGEEECNKNMDTFLECIDAVKGECAVVTHTDTLTDTLTLTARTVTSFNFLQVEW